MYGLETIFIPPPLLAKLDVFQFKGLRKILVMDTTFINRANTNAKVSENANRSVNPNLLPNKSIRPFSTYVHNKQEALLKHIVRSPNEDPLRQCTLDFNRPTPFAIGKRRVGRPRLNWTVETYKRLFIKHGYGTAADFQDNPNRSIRAMENNIRLRTI